MKVKIKTLYFDTVLKKEINEGEVLDVTDARGKVLIAANVADKTTTAAAPATPPEGPEETEADDLEMNQPTTT